MPVQDAENIAAPVLPPIGDDQQLAAEAQWLSDTIQAGFAVSQHGRSHDARWVYT